MRLPGLDLAMGDAFDTYHQPPGQGKPWRGRLGHPPASPQGVHPVGRRLLERNPGAWRRALTAQRL